VKAEQDKQEERNRQEQHARVQQEQFYQQMRMQEKKWSDEKERFDTRESQIKKKGDTVKKVLYNMPHQAAEIPLYSDAVDRIYAEYEIPDNIKISLLNPYLSPAAHKLIITCHHKMFRIMLVLR
jgi:hypothetical protein